MPSTPKFGAPKYFLCIHDGCVFRTDKRKAIVTHLLRTHSERKEDFECEYCEKQFTDEDLMGKHLSSVHPTEQFRYTCVSRIERVVNQCLREGACDNSANKTPKVTQPNKTAASKAKQSVNSTKREPTQSPSPARKSTPKASNRTPSTTPTTAKSLTSKAKPALYSTPKLNININNTATAGSVSSSKTPSASPRNTKYAKVPPLKLPLKKDSSIAKSTPKIKTTASATSIKEEPVETEQFEYGQGQCFHQPETKEDNFNTSMSSPQMTPLYNPNDFNIKIEPLDPECENEQNEISLPAETEIKEEPMETEQKPTLKIKLNLKKIKKSAASSTKASPSPSPKETRFSESVSPGNSSAFDKSEVYHMIDELGRRCCPFCDYRTTKNTIRVHLSGRHHIHFVGCSMCSYKAAFPHQITQHGSRTHEETGFEVEYLPKEYREAIVANLEINPDQPTLEESAENQQARCSKTLKRDMPHALKARSEMLKSASHEDLMVDDENVYLKEQEEMEDDLDVDSDDTLIKVEESEVKEENDEDIEQIEQGEGSSSSADEELNDLEEIEVHKQRKFQTSKTDYYDIHFDRNTGKYSYRCSLCPFVTEVRATIYTHKYRHEAKNNKCPYCDFRGSPRSVVVGHIQSKHKGAPVDVVTTSTERRLMPLPDPPPSTPSPAVKSKPSRPKPKPKQTPVRPGIQNPPATPTIGSPQRDKPIIKTIIKVPQIKRTFSNPPTPKVVRKPPFVADDGGKMSLNRQYRINRHGFPKFQCLLCPYATDTHPKIKHHLYRHKPQRYMCPYCGFRKYPRSYVVRHVRDTHKERTLRVIDLLPDEDTIPGDEQLSGNQPIPEMANSEAQEEEMEFETIGMMAEQLNPIDETDPSQNHARGPGEVIQVKHEPQEDISDLSIAQTGTQTDSSMEALQKISDSLEKLDNPKARPNREKRISDRDYTQHPGESPMYTCNQCSFVTDVYNTIHSHMYKHEERFYKCHYCPFRRSPRSYVETHIKEVHRGKKVIIHDLSLKEGNRPSGSIKRKQSPVTPAKVDNKKPKLTEDSNRAELKLKLKRPLLKPVIQKAKQVPNQAFTQTRPKPSQNHTSPNGSNSMSSKPPVSRHVPQHKGLEKTIYKCVFDPEKCNHISKDRSKMKQHLFSHVEYKPYACVHCDATGTQSSHIKNHIRSEHPEFDISSSYKFKRHNYLEKHIEDFLEKSVCVVTIEEFQSIMELKYQKNPTCKPPGCSKPTPSVRVPDKDEKGYKQCPHCGWKTRSEGLSDHIKMRHMDPRFQCYYCDFRGFYRSEIKKHQKVYHPRDVFLTINLQEDSESGRLDSADENSLNGMNDGVEVSVDDDEHSQSTSETSVDPEFSNSRQMAFNPADYEEMDFSSGDSHSSSLPSVTESHSTEVSNHETSSTFPSFRDSKSSVVEEELVVSSNSKSKTSISKQERVAKLNSLIPKPVRKPKPKPSHRFVCGHCSFSARLRVMVKMHCQNRHPSRALHIKEVNKENIQGTRNTESHVRETRACTSAPKKGVFMPSDENIELQSWENVDVKVPEKGIFVPSEDQEPETNVALKVPEKGVFTPSESVEYADDVTLTTAIRKVSEKAGTSMQDSQQLLADDTEEEKDSSSFAEEDQDLENSFTISDVYSINPDSFSPATSQLIEAGNDVSEKLQKEDCSVEQPLEQTDPSLTYTTESVEEKDANGGFSDDDDDSILEITPKEIPENEKEEVDDVESSSRNVAENSNDSRRDLENRKILDKSPVETKEIEKEDLTVKSAESDFLTEVNNGSSRDTEDEGILDIHLSSEGTKKTENEDKTGRESGTDEFMNDLDEANDKELAAGLSEEQSIPQIAPEEINLPDKELKHGNGIGSEPTDEACEGGSRSVQDVKNVEEHSRNSDDKMLDCKDFGSDDVGEVRRELPAIEDISDDENILEIPPIDDGVVDDKELGSDCFGEVNNDCNEEILEARDSPEACPNKIGEKLLEEQSYVGEKVSTGTEAGPSDFKKKNEIDPREQSLFNGEGCSGEEAGPDCMTDHIDKVGTDSVRESQEDEKVLEIFPGENCKETGEEEIAEDLLNESFDEHGSSENVLAEVDHGMVVGSDCLQNDSSSAIDDEFDDGLRGNESAAEENNIEDNSRHEEQMDTESDFQDSDLTSSSKVISLLVSEDSQSQGNRSSLDEICNNRDIHVESDRENSENVKGVKLDDNDDENINIVSDCHVDSCTSESHDVLSLNSASQDSDSRKSASQGFLELDREQLSLSQDKTPSELSHQKVIIQLDKEENNIVSDSQVGSYNSSSHEVDSLNSASQDFPDIDREELTPSQDENFSETSHLDITSQSDLSQSQDALYSDPREDSSNSISQHSFERKIIDANEFSDSLGLSQESSFSSASQGLYQGSPLSQSS